MPVIHPHDATASSCCCAIRSIHRAVRRQHATLLSLLEAADFEIDQAWLITAVRRHLGYVSQLLTDESATLDLLLPSASDISRPHQQAPAELRAAIALLEVVIRAVEGAGGSSLARTNGEQLYLTFSQFVGEHLMHMAVVEREINTAWGKTAERYRSIPSS